jgi:hypothetical protein
MATVLFVCHKYPEMRVLVNTGEVRFTEKGPMRLRQEEYVKFHKGRLELDDVTDKEHVKNLRTNTNYGTIFYEVDLKELEAIEEIKKKADPIKMVCPYCAQTFGTVKKLMEHGTVCKERLSELRGTSERIIRGVQTTGS